MKDPEFKKNGFSLLELVAAVGILTVFIFVFTTNVSQIIEQTKLPTYIDMQKRLSLKAISTRIQTRHYWVWNIDTDQPTFGGPNDPSVKWIEYKDNYTGVDRVTTSVNFQKRVGNDYVDFSALPFDGNSPRDAAIVTFEVYFEDGTTSSRNVYMKLDHTQSSLEGVMLTLQDALLMYHDQNASFPSTLDMLVPTFLDEIPNNPLTAEHEKLSHIEELSDWGYSDGGIAANFWPQSNPDIVTTVEADIPEI